MCLTVDSDPLGDSDRGAQQTRPLLSLPQLSSQRPQGSGRMGGGGEQQYQVALDSCLGRGRGGHLGLRLGIWMKTAVSCATPRTDL